MADKFEAAFHGMSDDDVLAMIKGLAEATQREDRKRKILVVIKNLLTTMAITALFTVSLLLLGWWGDIPAVLSTTAFFTYRDFAKS